jgi:Domain of unknown function DUF11/Ig-like domain CHU_C associated/Secretion system C-terminal sorting domain/NHL repeat/WD domain, G-beta repeat
MKRYCSIFVICIATIHLFGQQTFTDFQDAGMVIGQPNFQSWLVNYSDSVAYGPVCSAISSKGMLAVAEQSGGSVKIWYKIPEKNGQPADVEVGNLSFSQIRTGPSQAYAQSFDGVAWSPDGNKLIATCGTQNRVLIWNSIPQTNGQPADVVLGQPNFTSTTAGTSQTTLDYPCGVMISPLGKLLISDYNNNRVLIWNAIPTVNAAPADVVIGQPTFSNKISGNKANQLYRPRGVAMSPDGRLLIACSSSHHIFIYDSIPVSNRESATVVIGQDDFKESSSGTSDSTMYLPYGITVTADGKLAIAEFGNNRVLLYNSLPKMHGAHADNVLGQPDFNSSTNFAPSGSPGMNNFSRVSGISADLNGRLFVNGRDMHRVMVFGELPSDSADLAVTIASSDTVLCELSTFLYGIKVFNAGPDTAFNVVSTTALPYGCTLKNYYTLNGSYNKSSGYWKISSIAPFDTASLILEGSADPLTGSQILTTYANVIGSSAIDKNLSDNGVSINVVVSQAKKPEVPTVRDITICPGTHALLSAEGSGTIRWYTGEIEMNPIATGPTYYTDSLFQETTFWVETYNVCRSNPRIPLYVGINPTYHIERKVYVCSGDGYIFPDGLVQNNIVSTVSHASYLTSVYGCDSTIVTTILVRPTYSLSETITLYNGESYTFPDGTVQYNISSPVTHTSNLASVFGCDSIIVTNILVRQVYSLSETITLCNGESYTFPDGTVQYNISSPVTHTSNLTSVFGYDSTIVTVILVRPAYSFSETITLCNGESYTFPDGTVQYGITSPVTHTSNLTSVFGCDSIIVTNINVNTVDASVVQDGSSLKATLTGATYQWIDDNNDLLPGENNQDFIATQNGSYAVIISENGCSATSDFYPVTVQGIRDNPFENQIIVYPNPVGDKVTLDFPSFYNSIQIQIVNLTNQIMNTHSFANVQKSVELDVRDLKSGIYMILVNADNNKALLKIVKE